MLVATTSWIGRNERMWQIRDSGRSLILSTNVSFLGDSFWDFVFDSAIKESQFSCKIVAFVGLSGLALRNTVKIKAHVKREIKEQDRKIGRWVFVSTFKRGEVSKHK